MLQIPNIFYVSSQNFVICNVKLFSRIARHAILIYQRVWLTYILQLPTESYNDWVIIVGDKFSIWIVFRLSWSYESSFHSQNLTCKEAYSKQYLAEAFPSVGFGGCSHWCFPQGACLDIKMLFHQYRNSHHKDKTVSRPSYLYHGNHHTWKDHLYIETGPSSPWRFPWQQPVTVVQSSIGIANYSVRHWLVIGAQATL